MDQVEEIMNSPPQPLFKDAGLSTPGLLLLMGRMEGKIDLVLVRTEGVERSVKEVDIRLRDVEKCVVPRSEIDQRFDAISTDIEALGTRMNSTESFISSLKGMYAPVALVVTGLFAIVSGYLSGHLKLG